MHGRSRRTRAWQGHARARGHTTRMRVATNRAGILLAIMRPGQLKREEFIPGPCGGRVGVAWLAG